MKKTLEHLKNMLLPLMALLATVAVALGVYIAIWGWARFKLDFWPLDSSRVGPNICASLFLVVLVIAHNEFVVTERAKKEHENHRQLIRDSLGELLHPTEEIEANIAAQSEDDFRQLVLKQLDETSPGGLGTIADTLKALTPKTTRAPRTAK